MPAGTNPEEQGAGSREQGGRLPTSSAFTLIEMLTVLAIVAIFAGVLGFAFRGSGSETVGLQSAQSTLASLHSLARNKAALEQANAAVFVYAGTDDPEQYLRFMIVAFQDFGGDWNPVGEGVYLPKGVYLLPNDTLGESQIGDEPNWLSVRSTALGSPGNYGGLDGTWMKSSSYQPTGTTSAGVLLVANGRPEPDGSDEPFVFLNAQNVRGISLSVYGGISRLNSIDDLSDGLLEEPEE